MADESADVSSKEELSVCGRWLESGKPDTLLRHHPCSRGQCRVTHTLLKVLQEKGISLKNMRGLGVVGTNTMSGNEHCLGTKAECRYE